MTFLTRACAAGAAAIVTGTLVTSAALAADATLIASSCSGCHTRSDTLNTGIPRIRGLPEGAFTEAMRGFRGGQRQATVMDRIAKGLTDDEIRQLAAFFSAQK